MRIHCAGSCVDWRQLLNVFKIAPMSSLAPLRPSPQPPKRSQSCSYATLLPIGLGLLALALVWDGIGLDRKLQHVFSSAQSFPWRDFWVLSSVLHDGAKKLSVLLGLVFMLLLLTGRTPFQTFDKRTRYAVLIGALVTAISPSILKHYSSTSCPWHLQEFGGTADYVSHWELRPDAGPGQCFPAGHPFIAFAFWPLCMPALLRQPRSPRAVWVGIAIGLAGVFFGLVQMARGAHFLSHVLWSAALAWNLAHGLLWLLHRQPPD